VHFDKNPFIVLPKTSFVTASLIDFPYIAMLHGFICFSKVRFDSDLTLFLGRQCFHFPKTFQNKDPALFPRISLHM